MHARMHVCMLAWLCPSVVYLFARVQVLGTDADTPAHVCVCVCMLRLRCGLAVTTVQIVVAT